MTSTLKTNAETRMAPPSHADRTRKEEYFEILDETIRTNPYRKAATAMASVMSKHGITSEANKALGKSSPGIQDNKKCALTRALRLAQSCNQKLNVTKDELQALCCGLEDVKTEKPFEPASSATNSDQSDTADSPSDRAVMAGHLLTLIGEAQTIAKRIYETAVGLHVAEDYLRQPDDLKLLDFSSSGRIQIPNYNFNHASQLCLEWLHSTATKWLRGFREDNGGKDNSQFIKVFDTFTKAVKDYTEAVCLANQVFRVLLYPNTYGKETLQEYVLSLGHVLKNDIIMEIQALRRAFDSIQYSFERLSWSASMAWMKHSGKNISVETLNETGIQVDHSAFQHKFYEGPSKLKKKNKSESTTSNSNKKKMNHVPPSHAGQVGKSMLQKNAKNKGTPSEEQGEVTRWLLSNKLTGSNNAVALSRTSQSAPEVSRSKKPSEKAPTGTRHVEAVADAPSETGISVEDSNSRLGLLKLLKNDKGYSFSSQSTIESNVGKKKANPLTPPPHIPSAWRKQFGAVFGAHLIPPTVKVSRKARKKTAIGLNSSTGFNQNKQNKKPV